MLMYYVNECILKIVITVWKRNKKFLQWINQYCKMTLTLAYYYLLFVNFIFEVIKFFEAYFVR